MGCLFATALLTHCRCVNNPVTDEELLARGVEPWVGSEVEDLPFLKGAEPVAGLHRGRSETSRLSTSSVVPAIPETGAVPVHLEDMGTEQGEENPEKRHGNAQKREKRGGRKRRSVMPSPSPVSRKPHSPTQAAVPHNPKARLSTVQEIFPAMAHASRILQHKSPVSKHSPASGKVSPLQTPFFLFIAYRCVCTCVCVCVDVCVYVCEYTYTSVYLCLSVNLLPLAWRKFSTPFHWAWLPKVRTFMLNSS